MSRTVVGLVQTWTRRCQERFWNGSPSAQPVPLTHQRDHSINVDGYAANRQHLPSTVWPRGLPRPLQLRRVSGPSTARLILLHGPPGAGETLRANLLWARARLRF